jgi:hypothetical protein
MDHITFNLSQANKITAVSNSSVTNGYIEFEDNDGNTMRYEIDANNYVVFGPVGSLSELAGPVSQLQFTCYDACDLDTALETPIDVNLIRTVKAQSTLNNSAALGRNQSFTAQAYLRANALDSGGGMTVSEESGSELEFDTTAGSDHSLAQIDANNYLCAYQGPGSDGWSVILTVDTSNWTITKSTAFEFETSLCNKPALVRIDAANYLCVYGGPGDDGWAVILTVDTVTGTITMGTPFEFDEGKGIDPALSQIDSDDFLCVYTGTGSSQGHGWGVVLTVNTVTRTITKGPLCEFEAAGDIEYPALSRVDDTHHLCAYRFQTTGKGAVSFGRASVVNVNTVTRVVTKQTDFQFESELVQDTELHRIDQEHHLCAYGLSGNAVILTVDTGTWAIGKGTTHRFEPVQCHDPALVQIDETDFLCVYGEFGVDGVARVLRTDIQTDTVTSGDAFMYSGGGNGIDADLAGVDDTHFLCAYEGERGDGFAVILTVGEQILP